MSLAPCAGTSPSRAANSRPVLKRLGSPMVATMALTVSGPTPGMVASLRHHIAKTKSQINQSSLLRHRASAPPLPLLENPHTLISLDACHTFASAR